MKLLPLSLGALLLLSDAAAATHYLEPTDTSRAHFVGHRFGAKKHVAKDHNRDHKKQRELDAAHKAALRSIKEPPAPKDPWAQVRP
jgi:hypothetical protein